jgi:AraC family transcriptional regulator, ethanolamine operon transcriptional activator
MAIWGKTKLVRHQQQAHTAPGWCVSEARDADEHAHNLRNWQQQYDQLSDGAFYGRIDEVVMPDLQLFREHTSQAVRQQCNVWPDALWLGLAVQGQECRINGQTVSSGQLMCRPGNHDFELLTPEAFDIFGIVIRQQELQRVAEAQQLVLDSQILRQPRRDWSVEKLAHLRYWLGRLLTTGSEVSHAGASPVAAALQQDLLIMTVLELLQYRQPQQRQLPSQPRRLAVVNQVRDYLEAHPGAPLTITELCERVHVSRRTLQYSFETILGISPLRYLRVLRLNTVRRELSKMVSADDVLPIACLAARWGFCHPGEFARDYKQLFGESPSQTRLRAASGCHLPL